MKSVLLMAAFILGLTSGCRSDFATVAWSEATAEYDFSSSRRVRLHDGSQLVSGTLERDGPESARAIFTWLPGARTEVARIEVRLFPSNGGESIDVGTVEIPTVDGAQATVDLTVRSDSLAQDQSHWLMIRFQNREGSAVETPFFPGNWISLGAIREPGRATTVAVEAASAGLRLAVGGDANLGRRQNGLSGKRGPADALERLAVFTEADLSFLNLECVLSEAGDVGVEKGEPVPFYFRGRPEQARILTEAGVDVVGTANNHSGDYGDSALLDQSRILREAGVLAPGSGPNMEQACSPVFIDRDGVTVGFISADATLSLFGATDSTAGTCHVPRKDPAAAMAILEPFIATAREKADVVFVAMHWGKNRKSRPSAATRALGAALIEAGVDAVLGSSAHRLQGVEIVNGRPILYDSGNLLFDSHAEGEMARSGVFVLEFDSDGVHRVEMHPIDVDYGFSSPALGNSAARTLMRFRDLSAELGTAVRFEDGAAHIALPDPPLRPVLTPSSPVVQSVLQAVDPATHPPGGCLADSVPDDAAIGPYSWGPLQLVGARMKPEVPGERRTVWVETWWKTEARLAEDLWVYQRVKSVPHKPASMWWADHEHCDWSWPTSRWQPGQLYRDVYGVRPPKAAEPGPYELVIGVIQNQAGVGKSHSILEFQYR